MASWHWLSLALYAMATRFEVLVGGEEEGFLRAAGEAALEEIRFWEATLSRFRSDSEVFHLNAWAAQRPVPVSPRLFRLLQKAVALSHETEGAFDPTVAPLMRWWGLYGEERAASLEEALACVGVEHLLFDEAHLTVGFDRPGVELDLGAIGKGFALEEAGQRLREEGMEVALLHAGTSTVYALEPPPGQEGWKVAVRHPRWGRLASVSLQREALSVSGPYGRKGVKMGKEIGHLLHPRTGQPVEGVELAAVVAPSPTEADAFSTAASVLGEEGCQRLSARRPEVAFLLVLQGKRAPLCLGPQRFE